MPRKGYLQTKKHRENNRKAHKGKKPWNKGIPEDPKIGFVHQKVLRICKICGKKFTIENRHIKRGGIKYCSKKCNPYFQSLKKYSNPNERARAYYYRHLEECRKKNRIHGAKLRQDPKFRRYANKVSKEWKKKNPERAKKNVNNWKRKHPLEVKFLNAKRSANQKKAGGKLYIEDVKYLLDIQKYCPYCRKILKYFEIDHIIPLSKKGNNSKENIILACPNCNRSKGDKLLSEWTKTKNFPSNVNVHWLLMRKPNIPSRRTNDQDKST